MKHSKSKEYHRKHKINSYNQQFVYYKPRQPTTTVRYHHQQNKSKNQLSDPNHLKIKNMRESLQNMFQLSKPNFHNNSQTLRQKSIQSKQLLGSRNRAQTQIMKYSQYQYSGESKNNNNNNSYNQKLDKLTCKLREIAEKSYENTSTAQYQKFKQKNKGKSYSINSFNPNYQYDSSGRRIQPRSTSFSNLIPHNYSQQLRKYQGTPSQSLNDPFQNNQMEEETNHIVNDIGLINRTKSMERFKNKQKLSIPRSTNLEKEKYSLTIEALDQSQCSEYDTQLKNYQEKTKVNNYLETIQKSDRKNSKRSLTERFMNINSEITTKNQHAQQIVHIHDHRAAITDILLNEDLNSIITSSNDYSIRNYSLQTGQTQLIRKHNNRINCISMLYNNRLFSGGDDCKLKCQQSYWKFSSPVCHIASLQNDRINIGTRSTVQLYDIHKRKKIHYFDVNTRNYQMFQKANKQFYFANNHNLYYIDWRVPDPLISLVKQNSFVDQWISDPHSIQFYQYKQNKILHCLNNNSQQVINGLQNNLKHFKWLNSDLCILNQNSLEMFDSRKSFRKVKHIQFPRSQQTISQFQIYSSFWTYGTNQGQLFIYSF